MQCIIMENILIQLLIPLRLFCHFNVELNRNELDFRHHHKPSCAVIKLNTFFLLINVQMPTFAGI